MSSLISACKNVTEKIDFDNSSLKIDETMSFGHEILSIRKICMEDSFIKSKKGKETGVRFFIQAIASSYLKDSMKEICRSD